MKHYVFTVHLSGYGKDIDEAWQDATETFAQDPGAPGTEDLTVEDDDWDDTGVVNEKTVKVGG